MLSITTLLNKPALLAIFKNPIWGFFINWLSVRAQQIQKYPSVETEDIFVSVEFDTIFLN